MNRRSFIKNTALAATMAGLAPSVMASDLKGGKKKKIIFVFRGVSFTDAKKTFENLNSTKNYSYFLLKYNCQSSGYSHIEGITNLTEKLEEKYQLWFTEDMDRYLISQVVADAFSSTSKKTQIIYLHHTEIGHSSNKLYQERIEEFFTELGKVFDPTHHKVIVTADIGRNEKLNSCGGRDHSNPTCLETFALYLGGDATKLQSNVNLAAQNQILLNKF